MSAYKRILVAVDGSDAGTRGLREAVRLAKSGGAQLVIVHVVSEFFSYVYSESAGLDADRMAALRAEGQRVLDAARALAARQGVKAKAVLRETVGGPAADPVLREARKQRAELIVLGTHGRRGLRRLVLGSDAEQIVRASPVPVLLVRAP
ncbi:MAG TPA: universal stress protein [Burkholderiales bacterium]|nr:universal stress protein [Burkholderiales bacterium]